MVGDASVGRRRGRRRGAQSEKKSANWTRPMGETWTRFMRKPEKAMSRLDGGPVIAPPLEDRESGEPRSPAAG